MRTKSKKATSDQRVGKKADCTVLECLVKIDQNIAARHQVHLRKDLIGGKVMF